MAPDATLLVAQPYEPNLCPVIEKAIRKSDLGLNPASDGKVVGFPSRRRRRSGARRSSRRPTHSRAGRIEMRHHRHDANEKIKKDAKASRSRPTTRSGRSMSPEADRPVDCRGRHDPQGEGIRDSRPMRPR